jgi:hypothetical protein
MEAIEYLREVQRTVSDLNTPKTFLLGLRGETGEVADLVKKAIGHGHGTGPEFRVKMIKELGDCAWYAVVCLVKVLGAPSAAVHMNSRYLIPESLEDLADMLCEAGSKLGHATFPFEAADAGQEFFALVHTLGQGLTPPVSVEEIYAANRDKLRARYPEGFSVEASKVKGEEKIHASIPAAVQFEVDNYATAGNGYPVVKPEHAYTPACGKCEGWGCRTCRP